MGFITIASATLVFTLVLIVFSEPRRILGAKERRMRAISESDTPYLGDLEGNLFDRFAKPLLAKLRRNAARRRKAPGSKSSGAKSDEKREKQLRAAGIYISASTYMLVKLLATVGLAGLMLLLTAASTMESILKVLIVSGSGMVAMLAPDYIIKFLAGARVESMRRQLPDMMDILSVSIDAGLSFDSALRHALDRFTGALKEEMTYTSMEMQMGKPRREALAQLAERCDIAELRVLVAAIIQSDQMGTPIKNVLKTQSAQLRANRKQAAQEKGMKAPVKMMLPMVAFIFPVLLIILMGPTVMNIISAFM